jgi:hypothetical protein
MKSPATEGCACSFAVLLHLYSAISSARREGSPARSGPPPCRRLHHEAANQPHLAHADPAQPRREASRLVYVCSAHVDDCGCLQSHLCRITEGKFGRKAGDRAYEKSKCRRLRVASTTWRLPQVTASVCHWRAGTRRPRSGPPRGVRIGRAARDQTKEGPDARCVQPLFLTRPFEPLGRQRYFVT